ncbi:hypothetical protein DU478_21400 [Thalassococcus profundi]|uniref:Uncharacterized protein n=1 Tax=Thalassococcus profundi TaxID=2282382 RepID=A0A369TJ69_9RHOB|nr:hypothetical protein DU478_21400 [Thalassococcus profundi]
MTRNLGEWTELHFFQKENYLSSLEDAGFGLNERKFFTLSVMTFLQLQSPICDSLIYRLVGMLNR